MISIEQPSHQLKRVFMHHWSKRPSLLLSIKAMKQLDMAYDSLLVKHPVNLYNEFIGGWMPYRTGIRKWETLELATFYPPYSAPTGRAHPLPNQYGAYRAFSDVRDAICFVRSDCIFYPSAIFQPKEAYYCLDGLHILRSTTYTLPWFQYEMAKLLAPHDKTLIRLQGILNRATRQSPNHIKSYRGLIMSSTLQALDMVQVGLRLLGGEGISPQTYYTQYEANRRLSAAWLGTVKARGKIDDVPGICIHCGSWRDECGHEQQRETPETREARSRQALGAAALRVRRGFR